MGVWTWLQVSRVGVGFLIFRFPASEFRFWAPESSSNNTYNNINSRIDIPKKDWGYALLSEGFHADINGRRTLRNGHLTSGVLQQLRDHRPPCPPDAESDEKNTVRQKTESGLQTDCAATTDALSQSSFLIDSKEKKDTGTHAHNACAPSPVSLRQPDPPSNPAHPATANPEDLPDWLTAANDPQELPW